MDREAFEALVQTAIKKIPEEFSKKIDNLVFIVEDWPDPEVLRAQRIKSPYELYAIYQGVSYERRLPSSYTAAMPDRIVIYQGPHEAAATSREDLEKKVLVSVWHEVGHYFGLSEKEIRKALE